MAPGAERTARVPGLTEDLKKLQAELLADLGSGDTDDDEEAPGEQPGAPALAGAAAVGAAALTERAVLIAAGEERVEDVTQLILRGQQLESLVVPQAIDFARLVSLEVLSLSNNRLTDITPLGSLVSLVEVNVNFNEISDLSPLYECEQLEKLFASHNQVYSIDQLDVSCPQLRELSLYANRLIDSQAVLKTLQGLPELRVLDLGENEGCAGPAQRYNLLQRLPKLETLDGQKLGGLDRRLATGFFEGANREKDGKQGGFTQEEQEVASAGASAPPRPCTAPAAVSSRPPLPGGGRNLALGPLPGQRLRSSRANLIDDVLTQSREPSPGEEVGGIPSLDIQHLDLSDPERTLHKLNIYTEALSRHLETLQMERDNLKFEIRLLQRDGRESGSEGLREQLALLEEENKNIPAVESEHELLVARVEETERELAAVKASDAAKAEATAKGRMEPAMEDDEVAELRWENQLLRKRLRGLLQYCEQLQQDELQTRVKTGSRPTTGVRQDLVAGPAADEAELERLVAENEQRLRQLRGEVRDTATALVRQQRPEAATSPVDLCGAAGVDVLTIGEGPGAQDTEWHGTR